MKLKVIPNEQTPKIIEYKPIDQLLKEDYKLLEKFISFSQTRKLCIGLASNQVACDNERITQPFFTMKDINGWGIYLQPEIIKCYGNKSEVKEGCLTWQGKTIVASRYFDIDLKYYNLKGEQKVENFKMLQAQVCQHECNHLLGVEEKFEEIKK